MKTTPTVLIMTMLFGSGACQVPDTNRDARSVALASVTSGPAGASQPDTSVVVRRVWEGFHVGWGSDPTPDGRSIVTAAPQGLALARIDLVSGEVLPIKRTGTWSEAQEWAETAVVSPSGEHVAYVYFSTDYGVRISGIDGSGERELIAPGTVPFYALLDAWHGDEILGTIWGGPIAEAAIVGISPVDGSVRIIKAFGEEWREERLETPLAVSPDGRFLAYGTPSPRGDADVDVIRTDDGSEVETIEGPANDVAVAWTSEGDALLIHSDRELTQGVWRIPMNDGRATGTAELVRGDLWGFEDIGSAEDAYFFGVRTDVPRVLLASFDPINGALISEPTPVGTIAEGQTRLPIWAPDGRALAYAKRGPEMNTGQDQSILVVRSLEGPEAREIPLPGVGLRRIHAWTPDGRIVASGKASDGKWYVWSVELQSGDVEALLSEDDTPFTAMAAVSRDGATLYTTREGEIEGDWVLGSWDLGTGAAGGVIHRFTDAQPGLRVDISPDGKTLAVGFREDRSGSTVLAILPASGGPLQEVFRQSPPDGISSTTGVFWPPEGERLFFATHGVPAEDIPPRLWMVEYAVSQPNVVELEGAGRLGSAGDFAVHPEGGRIAFVAGQPKSEIWMMTNLSGGER